MTRLHQTPPLPDHPAGRRGRKLRAGAQGRAECGRCRLRASALLAARRGVAQKNLPSAGAAGPEPWRGVVGGRRRPTRRAGRGRWRACDRAGRKFRRRDGKPEARAHRRPGRPRHRDEAMEAGEKDIDYMMFGDLDPGGESAESVLERASWWAEIFNVPCIGVAHDLAEVASSRDNRRGVCRRSVRFFSPIRAAPPPPWRRLKQPSTRRRPKLEVFAQKPRRWPWRC